AMTGGLPGRWSTSAAFVDYDRDGFLDLYIANYVNFRLGANKQCFTKGNQRDYCGPKSFDPEPDRLLHNRGNGSFENVSVKAGITSKYGSGLGVMGNDFDGDRWPDIF